jgi:hypothetical protein
MQQTELQSSICLLWLLPLVDGDVQQLLQMLDGCLDVAVLGVSLSQLLMSVSLLVLVVVLLAHLQELLQLDYGSVQVTQLLIDKPNPLVTVSLLLAVVGSLGDVQTLLKELERLAELLPLLELYSYVLVDSHQLLADDPLQLGDAAINSFLEGSLQIVHGLKYVQNLLLADTQALVSIGLSLDVLVIN